MLPAQRGAGVVVAENEREDVVGTLGCRAAINGGVLLRIGLAKREFGQRRQFDFARGKDSTTVMLPRLNFDEEQKEVHVGIFAVVLQTAEASCGREAASSANWATVVAIGISALIFGIFVRCVGSNVNK